MLEVYGSVDDPQSQAYIEYNEDTLQLTRLVLPIAEKCPHILISKQDGSELVRVPMYSSGEVDLSQYTVYDVGSIGIEEIFNGH